MPAEKQPLSLEQLRSKEADLTADLRGLSSVRPSLAKQEKQALAQNNLPKIIAIGVSAKAATRYLDIAGSQLTQIGQQIQKEEREKAADIQALSAVQAHQEKLQQAKASILQIQALVEDGHLSADSQAAARRNLDRLNSEIRTNPLLLRAFKNGLIDKDGNLINSEQKEKRPVSTKKHGGAPKPVLSPGAPKIKLEQRDNPGVILDFDNGKLIIDGKEVRLSLLQLKFIKYLYDNKNSKKLLSERNVANYIHQVLGVKSKATTVAQKIEEKAGRPVFVRLGDTRRTFWSIENLSLAGNAARQSTEQYAGQKEAPKSPADQENEPQVIFDPANKKLIIDGKAVKLSEREFSFIDYIYKNRDDRVALSSKVFTNYIRQSFGKKSAPGLIAASIERKTNQSLFGKPEGNGRRYIWSIANLSLAEKPKETERTQQGEIVLDEQAKSVTLNGKTVSLSRLNFAVVQYVFSHRNQKMSVEDLNEFIRKNGYNSTIGQVHHELREKFGEDFLSCTRRAIKGRPSLWTVGEKYKDYIVKEQNKQSGEVVYDRESGTLKNGEKEIQLNTLEFLVLDYILKHKKGKITKEALKKDLSKTESHLVDPDTIIRSLERRLGREIFLRGGRGLRINYSFPLLSSASEVQIQTKTTAERKTQAGSTTSRMLKVLNAILDNPSSITIDSIIQMLGPSAKTGKLLVPRQAAFSVRRAIGFIAARNNNKTAGKEEETIWKRFDEYKGKTGKKVLEIVADIFAKRPTQEIKKEQELILSDEEVSILMNLVGTLKDKAVIRFYTGKEVVFNMSKWIKDEYIAQKKEYASKIDPKTITEKRGAVVRKVSQIIEREDGILQQQEAATQYLLEWIRFGDKFNAPGDIAFLDEAENLRTTLTPQGFLKFLLSDMRSSSWFKVEDGTIYAHQGFRNRYMPDVSDIIVVQLQNPAETLTAPIRQIADPIKAPPTNIVSSKQPAVSEPEIDRGLENIVTVKPTLAMPTDAETVVFQAEQPTQPQAVQEQRTSRKQKLEDKAIRSIRRILSGMDMGDRNEIFNSGQMENKFGITRNRIAKMLQSGNIDAVSAKAGAPYFDFPTAVLLKFLGNKKLTSLEGKVDLRKLIAEEIKTITS